MSSFFYGLYRRAPPIKIVKRFFSVLYKPVSGIEEICFTAFQGSEYDLLRTFACFIFHMIKCYTPYTMSLIGGENIEVFKFQRMLLLQRCVEPDHLSFGNNKYCVVRSEIFYQSFSCTLRIKAAYICKALFHRSDPDRNKRFKIRSAARFKLNCHRK